MADNDSQGANRYFTAERESEGLTMGVCQKCGCDKDGFIEEIKRLQASGRRPLAIPSTSLLGSCREIANNAIYFADNSDYRSALWDICSLLGMSDDNIGDKFILSQVPAPCNGSFSDEQILAWAERHDIKGTLTDLRSMFTDAASLNPNAEAHASATEGRR